MYALLYPLTKTVFLNVFTDVIELNNSTLYKNENEAKKRKEKTTKRLEISMRFDSQIRVKINSPALTCE